LLYHTEEIKLFLNSNVIDIFSTSETHFTTKNYFSVPYYRLYYTSHPEGTAHGGAAMLITETTENYELLKYEEDSIQARPIKVNRYPYEINISRLLSNLTQSE